MAEIWDQAPLRVMVFDQSHARGNNVARGAEKAGWQPHVFDDPELANSEFDESFSALVIGWDLYNRIDTQLKAEPLFVKSYEFVIPRAILHTNQDDAKYLRPSGPDILISSLQSKLIASSVRSWLTSMGELRHHRR